MIQPKNFAYSHAFDETMELFELALSALGSQVDRGLNNLLDGEGINFIFGAHLLRPDVILPQNSIIVNLEQVLATKAIYPHYIEFLKRHPVLDYSPRNAERIRQLTGNPHVYLFKMGAMPQVARIKSAPQQDIDVLFYGVINDRRQKILHGLIDAGLTIKTLFGTYGKERDDWIARSKIVLNVHCYGDRIHELARTSYLMANSKAVVSECAPDTEIDEDVRAALVSVPYEKVVETCVTLVHDDAQRHSAEKRAFEIFTRRNQAMLLAQILPALIKPLPRKLNLGSGKAYDPAYLNIDIDPRWRPDILCDISAPTALNRIFFSSKYGLMRLEQGQFDEIKAHDVLEHVPNLTGLMTRCLELLRPGGLMRILVPFDLSWGAWQDPTHIRAFNERSWLYYTDWHWYLGWNNARFTLVELTLLFSPIGEDLAQRGVNDEEIFRTPRAVDSMRVVLAKRLLSEEEKQRALDYQHPTLENR
jgi:SAM-dependent methyltransferase